MIRYFISKIINYTIYYFRRIFLSQSEEKAMREYYTEYIKTQEDLHRRKNLPNIAIVNTNFSKYSETFIREKIKNIDRSKYYVHLYWGGYFPKNHTIDGHLISNYIWVQKLYNFIEVLLGKLPGHYLERHFIKSLKKNKIKLVFAEFGTIGVKVLSSCKKANIPLIITLRGYDIHHKDNFETNKNQYLKLFEYCSLTLCVSKEIMLKVDTLGFSAKTKYFHSAINTKLFSYSNHQKNPAIFLAIGRFTETKSPHLTILAFNEVLKNIPDAQLRMIGKDGGGELFEACHILAQALKIENNVHFLGIQTPEQVAQEMQNARVFAQHSLTTPLMGDKEGTPVSIMEAMASGLPIVATKHAGIQEIIENGVSGILVEEYDYMTMANEMIRVCNSNKLVDQLGKAATNAIQNNVLIQDNSRILEDIIEKHRLK